MGHINAGLEWLIQIFNDMWPLVLATFIGAWLAFQHHRHGEKRLEQERRLSAIRRTMFVLSSQADWLRGFIDENLSLGDADFQSRNRLQGVLLHDDFPKLLMNELTRVFDNADFKLMNEMTGVEQSFFDFSRLLKFRANRLSALDRLELEHQPEASRKDALGKAIQKENKRLAALAPRLLERYEVLLSRLDEQLHHEHKKLPIEMVDYVSWYFFAGACAISGVFFFSHWAVNARSLADVGLDISLVSAVIFAISLYASLAIGILVAVLSIISLVKKLRSFSVYFWTSLISIQPTVFLLWLDVSGSL